MSFRKVVQVVCILALLGGSASAQSITGTIIGSVEDPSNLPIAGASITLTQAATGAQRQGQTNEGGNYEMV